MPAPDVPPHVMPARCDGCSQKRLCVSFLTWRGSSSFLCEQCCDLYKQLIGYARMQDRNHKAVKEMGS